MAIRAAEELLYDSETTLRLVDSLLDELQAEEGVGRALPDSGDLLLQAQHELQLLLPLVHEGRRPGSDPVALLAEVETRLNYLRSILSARV